MIREKITLFLTTCEVKVVFTDSKYSVSVDECQIPRLLQEKKELYKILQTSDGFNNLDNSMNVNFLFFLLFLINKCSSFLMHGKKYIIYLIFILGKWI